MITSEQEFAKAILPDAELPDSLHGVLLRAKVNQENLIVAVDLSKVDVTRTHWPFLRDRRIDAYDGLTRRLMDG